MARQHEFDNGVVSATEAEIMPEALLDGIRGLFAEGFSREEIDQRLGAWIDLIAGDAPWPLLAAIAELRGLGLTSQELAERLGPIIDRIADESRDCRLVIDDSRRGKKRRKR